MMQPTTGASYYGYFSLDAWYSMSNEQHVSVEQEDQPGSDPVFPAVKISIFCSRFLRHTFGRVLMAFRLFIGIRTLLSTFAATRCGKAL